MEKEKDSKKENSGETPEEAAPENVEPAADETPQAEEPKAEEDAAEGAEKPETPDWKDRYARAMADFDNFRKRNNSVRADAYEEGGRDVIAGLLPVVDNLERAVAIETADEKLHTGVEMVLKQLTDLMEKRGVTVIDRPGEPFDPNLENAVMQGTPEDGEKGTVCQVLQKGYKMGSYVLRTAMVKVVPE